MIQLGFRKTHKQAWYSYLTRSYRRKYNDVSEGRMPGWVRFPFRYRSPTTPYTTGILLQREATTSCMTSANESFDSLFRCQHSSSMANVGSPNRDHGTAYRSRRGYRYRAMSQQSGKDYWSGFEGALYKQCQLKTYDPNGLNITRL